MKIAFIGLGNMGAPMARNLARAGHTVTGFDTMAPMPEGVSAADSAKAAAASADVVITMLPDGPILRAVADQVFIPFTTGGGISTVDDMRGILRAGDADLPLQGTASGYEQLVHELARSIAGGPLARLGAGRRPPPGTR